MNSIVEKGKGANLCSMGWLELKWIAVSVGVGFVKTSLSESCLILWRRRRRCRKLMQAFV
jgi:hypothetical protein